MLSNFAIPKRPTGHPCNCACNDCLSSDFSALLVERGGSIGTLNIDFMVGHVRRERAKPLNWSLPEQHCLLCGGTSINCSTQSGHYQIQRHNEQKVGDLHYSSWLIWPTSSYAGALFSSTERNLPKSTMLYWVAINLDLNPAHARVIGIRESDPWIELRVGFTELDPMDRERRIREGVRLGA